MNSLKTTLYFTWWFQSLGWLLRFRSFWVMNLFFLQTSTIVGRFISPRLYFADKFRLFYASSYFSYSVKNTPMSSISTMCPMLSTHTFLQGLQLKTFFTFFNKFEETRKSWGNSIMVKNKIWKFTGHRLRLDMTSPT